MKEERGNENEGSGVGGVFAKWENQEREPKSGAFHEEPSKGRGDGGAPPRAVVLAIRGLDVT